MYRGIPQGMTLESWIRQLMAEDRMWVFYKSRMWLDLRARVLMAAHNECEDCAAKGKYTRAKLVHHDHEVRRYPAEALSLYWTDEQGGRHKNLWALCQECHERRHERAFTGNTGAESKRLVDIEERFPERW